MKKLLFILFLLINFVSHGQSPMQGTDEIEMADSLRQDGKIYVVVAVIILIFIGILIYLLALDKKIGKIERDIDNNPQ